MGLGGSRQGSHLHRFHHSSSAAAASWKMPSGKEKVGGVDRCQWKRQFNLTFFSLLETS
jgi:hypothetical protein